jgi:hypothetical protein
MVRLSMYLVPITALLYQILSLTEGIRCQTSPDREIFNPGTPFGGVVLDFTHYTGEGGLLYRASTALLFWQSEEESCAHVGMSALPGERANGSLTLLWPLFLTFCVSQFVETMVSALQGRRPVGDINLVELSLAFAEAESMVIKPFEMSIPAEAFAVYSFKPLHRSLNIAPEMLLISLLWALNNLTSSIMAIFRVRHKYRLINTGVWGLTYLGAFSWSIIRLWPSLENGSSSWIFRFPTVFIVGFFPHIVVLVGMAVCGSIYLCALVLTALSLPPEHGQPATFKQRFSAAYMNLQANVHFSTATPLTFRLSDDFYTVLLSTGFTILTAASEAVYLNEGAKVHVNDLTWLERKRLNTMEQGLLYKKTRSAIPIELRAAATGRYEALIGCPTPSGYANERTSRNQDKDEALAAVRGETGVGFLQRGGRFAMALRLIQGTVWLILGLYAKCLLWMMDKVGIHRRPVWLQNLTGCTERRPDLSEPEGTGEPGLEQYLAQRAKDLTIDLETEMRTGTGFGSLVYRAYDPNDKKIDEELYGWWKRGGWWGEVDKSEDYVLPGEDDDATSIISYATSTTSIVDEDENESAWEDSGNRTPTQSNPTGLSRWAPSTREGTPDAGIDADRLAVLLDPHTTEDRNDARMLARRLRRKGVMTRSQHRREMHQERAAVVTSSRFGPSFSLDALGSPMSEHDEEVFLEEFILSTRSQKRQQQDQQQQGPQQQAAGANTWDTGAEGMGSAGPQCVVCQDCPRTILLWPCGCLCLCDDCRVNMAARNFSSCICCRTTTVAYSRLYVP